VISGGYNLRMAPRRLYRVHGMDCAHEIALLRSALENHAQVDALHFDLLKGRMAVEGEAGADAVIEAVSRTGLRAERWADGQPEARRGSQVLAIVSGVLLAVGVVLALLAGGRAGIIPWCLSAAIAMAPVLPRALGALRRLRPDMHLLMTIAVVGAIGLGDYLEASSVAFLYAVSLALEAWSVARARHAVEALLELAPSRARVVGEDGTEREVAAEEVAVGSAIRIRPGERVPLDGRVEAGRSRLDQSPLTGESVPVEREAGGEVLAGSINLDGALRVVTTKAAQDTTVARMVRLVEEAGARRSRSQRWVERFAAVYTPAVMAGALLMLAVPPALLGTPWHEAVYRSLALLVIACPCALVISTPVAIVAGLTAAARHGVLVKGGQFLERPSRLRVVALDKTGTLTRGAPRVVEVVGLDGHTDAEVLSRAAAVEGHSEHVLARAVTAAARERGVEVPAASEVRAHPGRGAEGTVDGRRYRVGSHRWLAELRAGEDEARAELDRLAGPGRSVLFVESERHVCGLIALADEVRDDARAHVEDLRAAGVARVVMLTGDNEPTARAIAREAGIDDVRAELLPEGKVEAVEALQREYGGIAMVGDGVNDAPAMARADLGVAMGAIGTDAALETADVALMDDDLGKLAWLVRHSRRTLGVIRLNVAAALAVKAAFVVLTLLGPASLWAAIAADMGTSLAVVFHSLRLLRR